MLVVIIARVQSLSKTRVHIKVHVRIDKRQSFEIYKMLPEQPGDKIEYKLQKYREIV